MFNESLSFGLTFLWALLASVSTVYLFLERRRLVADLDAEEKQNDDLKEDNAKLAKAIEDYIDQSGDEQQPVIVEEKPEPTKVVSIHEETTPVDSKRGVGDQEVLRILDHLRSEVSDVLVAKSTLECDLDGMTKDRDLALDTAKKFEESYERLRGKSASMAESIENLFRAQSELSRELHPEKED